MAKTNQSNKTFSSNKISKKLLTFILISFAVVGGYLIYQTNAATPSTKTMIFSDVSDITPEAGSGGYSLVDDTLNYHTVKVAKIETNGMLSFGGKGGGTTDPPLATQYCYVLRVDPGTTARVQLLTPNYGIIKRTIKAWPYDADPKPYQLECASKGNEPTKSVTHIRVLSGGPVYFYQLQELVTYPY